MEGERRPHAGGCRRATGVGRGGSYPRGAPVRMVDAQASMGEVEYAEWGSAPNLARLAGRLLDQMARFEVRSQLIMPCGEAALAAGEGFPRARHQPMSGSARPPRGNSAPCV
jgi:hypothetical protein